ncbi:DUF4260 domain-containing protein [Empedobacter stercoris]|uniref:DUF4260 domain-containing protein n=1 Tax=Empedobacter stercoris TaxID=1628248 RepID=UPI001CE17538|nr:DUF4260 domain-containing protein [Empedobacter stercoris]MCA4781022.1 DUF4260 domain-containing protein [Empedobacter stercoris]HJD86675.1 DUF4260 domain-containing protein [Empedobacter falsenii]
MKTILKAEQVIILILAIFTYAQFQFSWILFAVLFFSPDIMMLGYLINNKIGAISYNLVHSYIFSIGLILIGLMVNSNFSLKVGLICTAHIAFDRILGYGLKTYKGFKSTHLGDI